MIGAAAGAGSLSLVVTAAALFCQATLHVPRAPFGKPSRPVADYPGAEWRTAAIRAGNNIALEGWFVSPPGHPGGACVIVLHGIGDSRAGAAGFAPMFLSQGYSVLLPDSRHTDAAEASSSPTDSSRSKMFWRG
jgi:poly(3-hydroxybutyrate) depolymerase